MAVYVDPLMEHGTSATWRHSHSCHMVADTLEELNGMAARIGLKRSWLQMKHGQPHYDLTAAKRVLAVRAGAIEISWQDMGWREMAWRKGHRATGVLFPEVAP